MAKVRFKTNLSAHYEVRRMPALVAFLEQEGTDIMESANDTLDEEGYRMSSGQGRKKPQGRWAVRVYTVTNHAKRSNAINNTLVRLLAERPKR